MSLADASEIAPQLNLAKMIKSLSPEGSAPKRVIVMAPKYLKSLNNILSDVDDKLLEAYFMWKQIQAYGPYIEADAVVPLKQFSNELQGKVRIFHRYSQGLSY